MKIIEEKNISLAEARWTMEKKEQAAKAAEKELGYEQRTTLEYLRKFTLLTKEDAETAWKELAALNEGMLRDHQIAALLDVLPENEEEVKVVLMKERLDLTPEHIKAILEALAKVRPTKEAKKTKAARIERKEAPAPPVPPEQTAPAKAAPEAAQTPEIKLEKAEMPTNEEALKESPEAQGDKDAEQ